MGLEAGETAAVGYAEGGGGYFQRGGVGHPEGGVLLRVFGVGVGVLLGHVGGRVGFAEEGYFEFGEDVLRMGGKVSFRFRPPPPLLRPFSPSSLLPQSLHGSPQVHKYRTSKAARP